MIRHSKKKSLTPLSKRTRDIDKTIKPIIKKDKRQLIKSSNPFQKRQELKSHANNVKKS